MRLRFGPKNTNTRKSPDFKARCIGGYCPKHAYLKKHPRLGESHISSIRMYRGLLPKTCISEKHPGLGEPHISSFRQGFWAGIQFSTDLHAFPQGLIGLFILAGLFPLTLHSSPLPAPRSLFTLHSSLLTAHCSLLCCAGFGLDKQGEIQAIDMRGAQGFMDKFAIIIRENSYLSVFRQPE